MVKNKLFGVAVLLLAFSPSCSLCYNHGRVVDSPTRRHRLGRSFAAYRPSSKRTLRSSRLVMLPNGGASTGTMNDVPRLMVRWMAIPVTFSVLTSLIATYPDAVLRWLPGVTGVKVGAGVIVGNSAKDLVPRSLNDSFELGFIAAQLEKIGEGGGHCSVLLEKAQSILNAPAPLTYEQATKNIRDATRSLSNHRSGLRRLLGALSFVNVLSALSLGGIALSVLPALRAMWKMLPNRIKAALMVMWSRLLMVAELMVPLVEPLLYLIPLYCFGASRRFPADGGARNQVASLGAILAMIPFYYSCQKHLPQSTLWDNGDLSARIYMTTNVWVASYLMPMALSTKSKLLGFFAVAAVYGGLGFCAGTFPYGWFVGFLGEGAMNRSMFASVIITASFLGLRVMGVSDRILAPFQTGAAIFGTVAYGLSGLIKSEKAIFDKGHPVSFLYPFSLLMLNCLGLLWSYPALSNTAITFFVLWCTKIFYLLVGLNATSVLFGCSALYVSTLWLKMRPQFFASLFSM